VIKKLASKKQKLNYKKNRRSHQSGENIAKHNTNFVNFQVYLFRLIRLCPIPPHLRLSSPGIFRLLIWNRELSGIGFLGAPQD
jgi:hypothetical protein